MDRRSLSFTGTYRSFFSISSFIIATFLVMTAFLHAVVPHHHGEEHTERNESGQTTVMIAHAHEEKRFFDLSVFFVFFAFSLLAISVREDLPRRALVTRRRSPPPIQVYLAILFSQGILHPKIP